MLTLSNFNTFINSLDSFKTLQNENVITLLYFWVTSKKAFSLIVKCISSWFNSHLILHNTLFFLVNMIIASLFLWAALAYALSHEPYVHNYKLWNMLVRSKSNDQCLNWSHAWKSQLTTIVSGGHLRFHVSNY